MTSNVEFDDLPLAKNGMLCSLMTSNSLLYQPHIAYIATICHVKNEVIWLGHLSVGHTNEKKSPLLL